MASKKGGVAVPVDRITRSILIIRGQRVLLDRDLAEIYGVTPKRLNEAVKRNKARFPEDFMFRLAREEAEASRSQNATLRRAGALISSISLLLLQSTGRYRQPMCCALHERWRWVYT